ncbi:MAG: dihydroorotate dehydrogenase electron transfer subunit [Lachnospiraceae bacterium]|nr:dihydroorotate dehydrogenase electron transfer subunit [Lachnospiraceae bacterium]
MDQKQSVSVSRVLSREQIGAEVYDLRLKTPLARFARPGQFVGVFPQDASLLLPRPVSICDAADDTLRLVFRVAGKGTASFVSLAAGAALRIMGPLGNGYPVERLSGKNVLLLGGGIGIPPMLYLAKTLAGESTSVTSVLGYRDSGTFLTDAFQPYGDVLIATEDGSEGTKGTVLDACRAYGLSADVICACGPKPMLAAVKAYASERRIAAYLSLEERMACGVGACLACVVNTTDTDPHTHVKKARVCTEGPVFEAGTVVTV